MRSVNEKIRKAIFAKLRRLRRKLNTQGIPCVYSRSVLSHQEGDNDFKITFQAADGNGDTSLVPKLTIRTGQSVEAFGNTNFEHGLARIRELFKAQHYDHPCQTEAEPSPVR